MAMAQGQGSATSLPPGFRFHPTDEELILHYLRNRAAAAPCPVPIIADVDIYKFDPWDLPSQAVYGDCEWYFFSPRDRKYPNGIRPNRAAGSGYWKATGTDKPIHDAATGQGVGVKKALVFYKGRPPKGTKTSWIMHEYRLAADPLAAAVNTYKPIKFRNVSMRVWWRILATLRRWKILFKGRTLESRGTLCSNLLLDQDSFLAYKWVMGHKLGEDLFHGGQAPGEGKLKMTNLSPVSPLELLISPAQSPLKKSKIHLEVLEVGLLP